MKILKTMETTIPTLKNSDLEPSPDSLLQDGSEVFALLATKHIHNNPPQLTINAIDCKMMIAIWGRGSGKTETVLAPWFFRRARSMPRGTSALVSTTYTRLLEMVIPALCAGWERLGLKEGLHYWLYKYPPAELRIEKPHRRPSSPQHAIFWWNGHCTQLISLDRKALANGLRTQAIGGDEVRLWDYDSFAESIMPTIGGNLHFKPLPDYGSMCLVTDMPRTPGGKWLFKYEEEVNEKMIGLILVVQNKLAKLQLKAQKLIDDQLPVPANTLKLIKKWEKVIGELRRNCVFVSYASTLDNAHTIRLDSLKQLRRTLTKVEFDLSVLNKKLASVEDCYYGLLEPKVHGYYDTDYEYVDSLPKNSRDKISRDWRWDNDLATDYGLDLSFDYNNRSSNLVIGQCLFGEARFLNHLWTLNPQLLTDLVIKFDKYYKDYPTRRVRYVYDHTALVTNADDNVSYAEKVAIKLRELGWEVTECYIGKANEHQERFDMWGEFFKGLRPYVFRYNRDTCKHWQIAALQTGTKYKPTKKGLKFEKDKDNERSKLIPPYEATHVTEAGDTLAVFWLREAAFGNEETFADQIA